MSDADEFLHDVAAMASHIRETGHPLYQASRFWTFYNDVNAAQLRQHGLSNFKRSVNQNYFNWVPHNIQNNQFRNVARYWGEHPALDVLGVALEGSADLATAQVSDCLAAPEAREVYRVFVGLLWHYTRSTCRNGLTESMSEPDLGNPLRCTLAGRIISQDLANSIRERTIALLPLETAVSAGRTLSVVEIGAGYGRLGFVLLASSPCRYTVVDIPPALALSQWYLTTLFPGKCAFRFRPWQDFAAIQTEFEAAEIRFLTPDQFALCPSCCFDIGITISTLAEMTRAQRDFYLSQMSRSVSQVIYTKQWIEYHNAPDGIITRRDDFVLPDHWNLLVDRVDAVQNAFFERLWIRG